LAAGFLAGSIAGAGGLMKTGPGLLALAGADTYMSGTTLAAGTLALDNPATLGTGRFTISGGALDNTTPSPITLSTNNPQTWSGDFAFLGTSDLDLGPGAVTLAGAGSSRIHCRLRYSLLYAARSGK